MIRILVGLVVIAVVFAAVAAAAWHVAGRATGDGDPRRSRGMHRRDALARAEQRSMARLRGDVLPRTPQLGEPLPPLPAFTPASPLLDPPCLCPQPGQFVQDCPVHGWVLDTEDEPGPASGNGQSNYDALKAKYEQLFPDQRPHQVRELLHHHLDSDAAVDSILQRRIDPELLARLDKAKANEEVAGG